MATSYPGGYDSLPRPTASDTMDDTAGGLDGPAVVDNLSDAVEAVQAELGLDPAGAYATVAARLTGIEALIASLHATPVGTYGPAVAMDTLANTRVGGSGETEASYRFRAEQSSDLDSFVWYQLGPGWGFATGYTDGDGGDITITVQSDLDGVPSGTVLATTSHTPGSPADKFPETTFGTPATLEAGTLYHIVFTNDDASPTANYISVDQILQRQVMVPNQPNDPDDSYACFYKTPTDPWVQRIGYTPIIDITYANAAHQGVGYMEVEVPTNVSGNMPVVSGDTQLRELFTVTGGDRTINAVSLRLAKESGTDPVVLTLEDNTGTTIEQVSASTANLPVGLRTAGVNPHWLTASFSQPRTLTNGSTYRLRVSCAATTELWTCGMQHGSSPIDATTYFSDGYVQGTINAGTNWNLVTGLNTFGHLQFYFTTQG